MLLRKVDRSGVLDDVYDAEDLMVVLNNGIPLEIVETGLERLTKRRGKENKSVVELTDTGLVIPNFLDAQESPKSDAQRQREFREKRRASAMSSVTKCDIESQAVTSSHGLSQVVTPTCADPDPLPTCADPDLKPAPARDDSFDLFWERYDIKTHKADTIVLWNRLTKNDRLDVMLFLEQRIAAEERAKKEGWFCANRPNPATFLRKKRWKDAIPKPTTPQNRRVAPQKTQHQRNLEILGLGQERDNGNRGNSNTVAGDDICIVPRED